MSSIECRPKIAGAQDNFGATGGPSACPPLFQMNAMVCKRLVEIRGRLEKFSEEIGVQPSPQLGQAINGQTEKRTLRTDLQEAHYLLDCIEHVICGVEALCYGG